MGGLSGSSGGAASADGFLEVTRFNKAYVSIGGAPTVKCSSGNRFTRRVAATTASKNRRPRHETTAAGHSD